jgi:hypothetical protein
MSNRQGSHEPAGQRQKGCSWKLQQQNAAWELLLHDLDFCSLASTAATCTNLRDMVQLHASTVALQRGASETQNSFQTCLSQHSASLAKSNQCSASSQPADHDQLDHDLQAVDGTQPGTAPSQPPGTLLYQLYLQDLWEQFLRAGSYTSALQDCTCLAVLDLQDCSVSAAIGERTGHQAPARHWFSRL